MLNKDFREEFEKQVNFSNYFLRKGKKSTLASQLRKSLLKDISNLTSNHSAHVCVKTNYLSMLRFAPLFYSKRIKFRRKKKKDKIFFLLTEKKNLLYIQLYRLLLNYKKNKNLKLGHMLINFNLYSNLNQGQVLLNIKKLNNLGFYYIRFLRYNFYKKNYFFDAKRQKNFNL